MSITIYHNPDCGTSRNVLALIRHAGIEPTVIEYLKTPPDRSTLVDLLGRARLSPVTQPDKRARHPHSLALPIPRLAAKPSSMP